VPEPPIIFEVLSSSTAIVDRNLKADEYRATPSVQRYVMLEQTRAEAIVLQRSGDIWVEHRLSGLDAVLALPEVGANIALAEFYHRIRLPG
jgi:Uma2 family endonuclease